MAGRQLLQYEIEQKFAASSAGVVFPVEQFDTQQSHLQQ
jgi:hypothetical protein